MKTILVTGAIGSGKSEVCKYLAAKNFPVYNCDQRTKALYEVVPGLKQRIETELEIDWSQIRVIFSDEGKRLKLESIVYPLLINDIDTWKSGLKSELCFIESAIALDKKAFDGVYDEVLLVEADYPLRLKRNNATAERDSLQRFDLSKINYTLENVGTLEELKILIDNLLCKLI